MPDYKNAFRLERVACTFQWDIMSWSSVLIIIHQFYLFFFLISFSHWHTINVTVHTTSYMSYDSLERVIKKFSISNIRFYAYLLNAMRAMRNQQKWLGFSDHIFKETKYLHRDNLSRISQDTTSRVTNQISIITIKCIITTEYIYL